VHLVHATTLRSLALIVAASGVGPAYAMDIRTCEDQVILSGRVEGNEYRRLEDVLAQNPNIKTAVLRNSPGGDAATGYRVGELLREKGIATYVSGFCRSSCSRLFLGGKERYFTDDYAAGMTHVGFHSNYRPDGQVVAGAPSQLKGFVAKYSDGKADEQLVDRWVNLQDRRGFAYFFHPQALKRQDGVSILLCQGSEPGNQRWRQCEKISRHDALSMGIVTSVEIKRSCDAAGLQAEPAAVPDPNARP
jgi:hypothetical protein